MSVPVPADTVVAEQNINTTSVTADISGLTLSIGDLLVVFVTIDAAVGGTVSLTQTGFTEHWDTDGALNVTTAAYSKVLVSGDTSWTEIEATWTGNEKATIDVIRVANGDHDGIDVVPTPNTNALDTTPEFPAFTAATDSLALGHAGINGNVTMSVNPTGYTTLDAHGATGGGLVQSWTGSDGVSGSQVANECTLTGAQDSITGVIVVAAAATAGETDTLTLSQSHTVSLSAPLVDFIESLSLTQDQSIAFTVLVQYLETTTLGIQGGLTLLAETDIQESLTLSHTQEVNLSELLSLIESITLGLTQEISPIAGGETESITLSHTQSQSFSALCDYLESLNLNVSNTISLAVDGDVEALQVIVKFIGLYLQTPDGKQSIGEI